MADFPDLLPPALSGLGTDRLESPAERDRKRLGQEQFFELMIAQLRNQDPLKPLESNEFLSQVAQFSTVSGIESMQKSIADLASQLQSGQALEASTLVGRDVLVAGRSAVLETGAGLEGAIEVPAATGGVELSIHDGAGQLVRRIELGAAQAGTLRFTWDGLTDGGAPAPPGIYTVQASMPGEDGPQALETFLRTRVESVTLSGTGGATLNLRGVGSVGMSEIRELL